MDTCVEDLLTLANFVPPPGKGGTADSKQLEFVMSRLSGESPLMWFELLVQFLLSKEGDKKMAFCNPFLTGKDVAQVKYMTAGVLMTCNRLAQVCV